MRSTTISSRLGLFALTALAALSILATAADAGNGHGHGKKKHKKYRSQSRHVVRYEEQRWREPRHVVVRPARRVYAAPVYAACEPRYVSYRSPRVIVVRPAPYVRVGARIGSVDIGAVFGGRRQHSSYEYGCNFCESRYASFSSYDSHVQRCSHRPRNVVIQAQVWDDAGYGEWRGRDACDQGGGHGDRRYDDREYDDRYDDRDDDDRYDRRYEDDRYDD